MNDNYDLAKEQARRKALANLRIAQKIDKNTSFMPASDTTPKKTLPKPKPKEKESLGMIFLGGMLTLTSILLVSLCFITTMNSYDRAVDEAYVAPTIIANDNNGGGGGPLLSYPYPRMNHFENRHFRPWMIIRNPRLRM